MRKLLTILMAMLLFIPAALAEDALFPAMGEDGLWGYIDRTGTWRIEPQFTGCYNFRGDYAEAWMIPDGLTGEEADQYRWNHDCSGIIDRQGQWVLPPEYSIDSGYDGRSYGGDDTGIWLITQYDGLEHGSFDEPFEGFFDIPSGYFSGLHWGSVWPWIGDSPLIPVTDADTWLHGYVDRATGELVIPYRYGVQDPSPFSEGVAPVAYEDENGNALDFFFLIDLEGNEIPLPEGIHAEYGCFASEGLIAVVNEEGLYGYADLQGNLVIAPQFSYAREFEDGVAEVDLADGSSVCIDRTGAVIEGVSPDDPTYMDNGLAWVYVGLDLPLYSNEWQLIDRAGNVVSDTYSLAEFESREFDEGLQPVYPLDGGCVYLDETGAVALPGPYNGGRPLRGWAGQGTHRQSGGLHRPRGQRDFLLGM